MWIDTHCHLHDPRFSSDRDGAIARARQAGVDRMVTIGTDPETSGAAIELAGRRPGLAATVGVHPHEVRHLEEADYPRLEALAGRPGVIAYGEIGLDDHYLHSPAPLQRHHFRRQVRLAVDCRLPLVLHTREAFPDTLRILREEGADAVGGVFHCFTGGREEAREAIDLGFHLSFSGIVTFPDAAGLREVARWAPPDRILVETDSPYLAPVPLRGKRNEPANVPLVGASIAAIRAVPAEELARVTTANAERLFPRLPPPPAD